MMTRWPRATKWSPPAASLGKVTKVADAYVDVEVADGTEVVVQKAAVTTLLPKGTIKSL